MTRQRGGVSKIDIASPRHHFPAMVAMNVSLTPELDGFVRAYVNDGQYGSSSEVVRAALRLLRERDLERDAKLAWLRGEIQKGTDSGPPGPMDFAALKRRGRERLARERQQ